MTSKKLFDKIAFVVLIILTVLFLAPLFIVLMNSFKGQFYISDTPFVLPTAETFIGFKNYVNGIEKTGFVRAFGVSIFVTVFSVFALVLCTSMTAWYLVRVKSKFTSLLYYMFVFSMVVPFQMIMFTMSKVVDSIGFGNMVGIVFVYLGFGAGLSVFIFTGFIKSIPLEIEEAATIDGCGAMQTFFKVVLPLLKPTAITVAILNAMWIWNDYLLPYLILDERTIPVAVQYLQGGYGSRDMGALMACLVLSVIPIVIFYLFSQKYIIKGVVAGAVKG